VGPAFYNVQALFYYLFYYLFKTTAAPKKTMKNTTLNTELLEPISTIRLADICMISTLIEP
jgi:hypothetical protein